MAEGRHGSPLGPIHPSGVWVLLMIELLMIEWQGEEGTFTAHVVGDGGGRAAAVFAAVSARAFPLEMGSERLVCAAERVKEWPPKGQLQADDSETGGH